MKIMHDYKFFICKQQAISLFQVAFKCKRTNETRENPRGSQICQKLSSDTSDCEIIDPRVMLRGTIGT